MKVCVVINDIKERSNKDGRKYAFITVSEKTTQFELVIFAENLTKYRSIIKEGKLLIFYVDIKDNNSDIRYILKSIFLGRSF